MQHSGSTHYEKSKSAKSKIPHYQAKGIPGYTYGSKEIKQSPVSLKEFELLKNTVLWTDEDEKYIRMSYDVLQDQTDDILDVWYSFIKVEPHLAVFFSHKADHRINKEYMDSVRLRFKEWILNTAEANYDQTWLNYQHEIALRHHRSKKNKTDDADSVDIINFRYILALIYPLTATLKPFLAKKRTHDAEDVECMHQAWIKAVILQVCLWAQPYVKEGDY